MLATTDVGHSTASIVVPESVATVELDKLVALAWALFQPRFPDKNNDDHIKTKINNIDINIIIRIHNSISTLMGIRSEARVVTRSV